MKTRTQEALETLKNDQEINAVVYIDTAEGREDVKIYHWADLLEKHAHSKNMGKCYQEFNVFVNGLSLYSLDSFENSYNHSKDMLLVIANRGYDREEGTGAEFRVFNEVSSLLEQTRENLVRLIQEKEEKLIRPYIVMQLETLNQNTKIFPENEMGNFITFFYETLKGLFSFDKKSPSEISKFRLDKADPKVIRQQMLTVIEKHFP